MATALTVYQSKTSGLSTSIPQNVTPDTGAGNSFANTGREVLYIQTAGASGITPVIAPTGKFENITTVASPYGAVGASALKAVGPFPPGDYNDANGNVQVTWSGASGTVNIWVVQMPTPPV